MSDNEYTPTTDDVRASYMVRGEPITASTADKHDERAGGFDRWLSAHDAQVREEVIDYANEIGDGGLAATLAEHFALPIPSTGTENTDSDEQEATR